jgi:hypothetical protein
VALDGLSGPKSLIEIVEFAHQLPYGRPQERTIEGMLRERRGTCSLKHLYLADVLEKEFPTCRPQIVHRVYPIFPGDAKSRFGLEAACCVPEEGIVDVHRYLLITVNDKRLIIDATFPGPPWDGENSMQLACGDGRDFPSRGDPEIEKGRLERQYCIPEVREPFVTALSKKWL